MCKRKWASSLLDREWGKRWISRTNQDIKEKNKGHRKASRDVPRTPLIESTVAGVEAAFSDGRLSTRCTIVECVGFDPAWYLALCAIEDGLHFDMTDAEGRQISWTEAKIKAAEERAEESRIARRGTTACTKARSLAAAAGLDKEEVKERGEKARTAAMEVARQEGQVAVKARHAAMAEARQDGKVGKEVMEIGAQARRQSLADQKRAREGKKRKRGKTNKKPKKRSAQAEQDSDDDDYLEGDEGSDEEEVEVKSED